MSPDGLRGPYGMTADPTPQLDQRFSDPNAGPTTWPEVVRALDTAELYWLSTVRADGRPHVTPLIAVWHGDAIWFSTGADECKARNLAANPSCVLTTGRSDLSAGALDVVLEGEAEQVTDNGELEPIAEVFATKYGTEIWDFVVRDGAFSHRGAVGRALVFRVRPVARRTSSPSTNPKVRA